MLRIRNPFRRASSETLSEDTTSPAVLAKLNKVRQAYVDEFGFSPDDLVVKIHPNTRYYCQGRPEYIDTLDIRVLDVPDSFTEPNYARLQMFGAKVRDNVFGKYKHMVVSAGVDKSSMYITDSDTGFISIVPKDYVAPQPCDTEKSPPLDEGHMTVGVKIDIGHDTPEPLLN